MNQELQQKLFDKYPTLFCEGGLAIYCDDGWFNLIDEMLGKLAEINAPVTLYSVKEKFGQLTIYYDNKAANIISEYETKSSSVCEVCGDTQTACQRANQYHWYKVTCDQCATKKGFKKFDIAEERLISGIRIS